MRREERNTEREERGQRREEKGEERQGEESSCQADVQLNDSEATAMLH